MVILEVENSQNNNNQIAYVSREGKVQCLFMVYQLQECPDPSVFKERGFLQCASTRRWGILGGGVIFEFYEPKTQYLNFSFFEIDFVSAILGP